MILSIVFQLKKQSLSQSAKFSNIMIFDDRLELLHFKLFSMVLLVVEAEIFMGFWEELGKQIFLVVVVTVHPTHLEELIG